jgi:hypothetical protein
VLDNYICILILAPDSCLCAMKYSISQVYDMRGEITHVHQARQPVCQKAISHSRDSWYLRFFSRNAILACVSFSTCQRRHQPLQTTPKCALRVRGLGKTSCVCCACGALSLPLPPPQQLRPRRLLAMKGARDLRCRHPRSTRAYSRNFKK